VDFFLSIKSFQAGGLSIFPYIEFRERYKRHWSLHVQTEMVFEVSSLEEKYVSEIVLKSDSCGLSMH